MPDFYEKMKNKLRSEAQGADTVVWLAVSASAATQASGQFYQDHKPVSAHLPLASTRSSAGDEEELLTVLEQLAKKFNPNTTQSSD
ncbi:dehydrogenase/reductase SDR family member 12-like [Acipenser ruthenus]|uniref:dehydrogenase/reductase SDR family member 12-like n=1 Tax=Acipenser ruthenus TaxID=7906 RepID=UPI00145B26AA|nr:dehydrogenase/reductase SDR family member 12-like [Acipenser ruthenus]